MVNSFIIKIIHLTCIVIKALNEDTLIIYLKR